MLSINRNQSPEETVKKIDRACLWREVECGKIGWGFSFPLNDYKLSDFANMYCWNKIKSKLKLNFKIQINSASKQKQKQKTRQKRKATRNGNWTLREERKAEKVRTWSWAHEESLPAPPQKGSSLLGWGELLSGVQGDLGCQDFLVAS